MQGGNNMSRCVILPFILLAAFTAPVWADELPVIDLREGTNTIGFTLVNQSGGALAGMKVTIDKQQLPGWLAVEHIPGAVDVQRGARSSDKIYVKFIVDIVVESEYGLIIMDVLELLL
jgi:hypothetical protein